MKRVSTSLAAAFFCIAAHAAADSSKDMPTAVPESVGVDSVPLVRMSEWLRSGKMDVRSLVVVKDGKIVFERYGDGLTRDNNYELYSVTKTITSLLVGVLEGQGKLNPTTRVAPLIAKARPDLASQLADKQDIELRHLMSMSSGLSYQTREGTDPLYYGAPDRLRVAVTARAAKAPGTDFDYIDVNPVLVGTAVSVAAHEREDRFAEEKLFKPLGMSHYRWTGVDETGAVAGGWGLRLRPVDMAKIGMLMLDGGRWQGRQVVPQAWIKQMTTPSPAAADYGYYCWIQHVVEKGQPEFGAMGFKGQFITVLPAQHAVVVMTSLLPTEGGLRDATYLNLYRRMVNDYILPALTPSQKPVVSAARTRALRDELARSHETQGVPGTAVAFNDAPEK
ncbi:beta-lactamase [Caballeronia arationis]|jgi:CubicO group peptidase (beta-lactamase class C family)|uniref:CubicO group peptidase, beta-lactamase class C family n=1 Tax=Caballeronia arationis TaxID=1777142 RepID=A0A7Z7N2C3_9BURK|nr:serine hydrolase [Caballeronia arationis]SAK69322.1 beta-lactamase [Caballeronia arationis]SOE64830.1 CubicO group peptidase, beta-lactamase class C family [Caballeronia arationis]